MTLEACLPSPTEEAILGGGIRVEGLGFRGLGFRFGVLGFRVQGLGFMAGIMEKKMETTLLW